MGLGFVVFERMIINVFYLLLLRFLFSVFSVSVLVFCFIKPMENEIITYTHSENAGKHMICDLKEIGNMELLNDSLGIQVLLDEICSRYSFQILYRKVHCFEPIGLTMFYLLSESHISIHTFPERRFMALDIYTCRFMEDSVYEDIYALLVERFCAKKDVLGPLILVRSF